MIIHFQCTIRELSSRRLNTPSKACDSWHRQHNRRRNSQVNAEKNQSRYLNLVIASITIKIIVFCFVLTIIESSKHSQVPSLCLFTYFLKENEKCYFSNQGTSWSFRRGFTITSLLNKEGVFRWSDDHSWIRSSCNSDSTCIDRLCYAWFSLWSKTTHRWNPSCL